ncbi:MAG TPA: hypothetical protein VMR45_01590 [Patescibacteria group bacterium]|nr:hypothetical protein [Patescibacteria group bacterium]
MKQKSEPVTEDRVRIIVREIIREEVPPIVTAIVTQVVSEATTQILNVMAERFEKIDRRFDRLEAIVNGHSLDLDDHEIRLRHIEAHI